MPPSCAILGGFAIGARVALLWQHNANPSYKLASIPRYDDIVRTLGGVCARYWPVTGGWRGRSQHTAAWFAGFHWWRSGNITRTQSVNEYMLVLALCLVGRCIDKKAVLSQGTTARCGPFAGHLYSQLVPNPLATQ